MNYKFIIVGIVIIIIFWIFNDLLNFFESFYVGPCVINGEYGTFYNNRCIPFSESHAKISNKEVKVDGNNVVQSISATNDLEDVKEKIEEVIDYSDENACYPLKSDFGKICGLRHSSSNYGVKDFNKDDCEDGKTKVICDKYYYNKVDYNGNNISSTPCLEKSIDFDEACRYYQPKGVALKDKGYNVNSVGVKQKLYAGAGDCYHRNGDPDLSKARGICNLDYLERVEKLDHFPNNYKYNIFTDCNKINFNFNEECANKLGIPKEDVYAYVGGFDCNPGFGRAKCINKKKDINIPETEKQFMKDSRTDYLGFQELKKESDLENFLENI